MADRHAEIDLVPAVALRLLRSLPGDVLSGLHPDVAQLTRRHRPVAKRQIFGDAEHKAAWQKEPPQLKWMGQGWHGGFATFVNGVVIDYIEEATCAGEDTLPVWLLLLHVMGWNSGEQSLVRARQWFWQGTSTFAVGRENRTATVDSLKQFKREGPDVRTDQFFSVVGTSRDNMLDLCWASKWAIDEILDATEVGTATSALLQEQLAGVERAITTSEKGKALELLMKTLLPSIEGFFVCECNCYTDTEEIDLVVDNKCSLHPWNWEKPIILVECKNWSKPTGKDEVVLFKEKIRNRRSRCGVGIFVAWSGFTSKADAELLRSSQEDWMIIQLDGNAVKQAVETGAFTAILEDAWRDTLMR